jgi:hypothetical protein
MREKNKINFYFFRFVRFILTSFTGSDFMHSSAHLANTRDDDALVR